MNQFGAGPTQPSSSETLFPGFPTLDLNRLIKVVKQRLWLAMLIAAVFVGIAITYVTLAPKIYRSSAVIYVDPKNDGAVFKGIKGASSSNWDTLDALKSMAGAITNGTMILRVVDKLELKDDPTFLKPKEGGYNDAEIVTLVGQNVHADLRRGTRLIDVMVKDKSPERAKLMAEAFISEFQTLMREQNVDSSSKSRKVLEEEAAEQLVRVQEAEEELQAFRIANSDVSFAEDKNHSSQKLLDLDKLLSTAENEVIMRKSEYEQFAALPEDDIEGVLGIGTYGSQDHIQKFILARNQKRAEFASIKTQYEPGHPKYQQCKTDLAGLEEQVKVVAETVGETIKKGYARAVESEERLVETVREQKLELIKVDGVKQQYRALQRKVEAAYATYDRLLDRINDTDVSDGVDETVIRVFSEPLVPAKPISPKKKLTVTIAGVFGSMCGMAVVLGIGLLDRTMNSRQQVESTLGLSVLAEVPQAFDKNWDLKDSLLVTSEPNSLVSESFRALRTSLSSYTPRSVMVTSASPGEGKSFCASNLALLQANMGYRTLLVDADFCKPRMAELFIDPMRGPAAEGALTSQNLCQPTSYPNLFLLSCGRFTSNTGEPMNGEIFAQMLQDAYNAFDCVIIDTSPINVVSDALTYSRHADAVVLVVRSGKTKTDEARHAMRELQRMRASLAGCVLNGSSNSNSDQAAYVEGTSRSKATVQLGHSPASSL
ncbi:polysaccharide biosynthesis tyrosine autokinase [Verrucomicrobiales bacterium BCK34]|nr:polysaccharide biosynthesis tyrosine autokinase [Verrucomicrobiales bacterium BCK34]